MKPPLLLAIAGAVVFLAAKREFFDVNPKDPNDTRRLRGAVIGCSPDWSMVSQWIDELDIPPMPGAGQHTWKINTTSDSAQYYFDQGMNMYYGFHIIESMASFKKAARFDPESAMIQWAQALAYGPNINDVAYAASAGALEASRKANQLGASAGERDRMLIAAQVARYTEDSTISRDVLNRQYAEKMKEAYNRFPDDADVAALYADALMLLHPWDFWTNKGEPRAWTPEIRMILEKVLGQAPQHPGANHYYIHVMEPSPFAALALPSADRLGITNPGLSHLVHMPSHIYLRTGNYEKGRIVNEQAVKSYEDYLQRFNAVKDADFLYVIHNRHMQANHAMLAGQSRLSVIAAEQTRNSIPESYLESTGGMGNYLQYIHMTPTMVAVRFGLWDKLLSDPAPPAARVYENVLYQFGRGMAFTHQSKMPEAKAALQTLRGLMQDSVLREPFAPFSTALEGATVAEQLLLGTILMDEDNHTDAIAAFRKAVEVESNMVYNEPRDWMLNPTHYLGDALLRTKDFPGARSVFEQDLLTNGNNAWALIGLHLSYTGQKIKDPGTPGAMERFKKAAAKADIKIKRPVL